MTAYPDLLKPTTSVRIRLASGRFLDIPKATPRFSSWKGESPGDSYGGKPILNYQGRPAFAELVILWNFLDAGWEGAWIDTYRRRILTGFWPVVSSVLPKEIAELHTRLTSNGGTAWDVLCWASSGLVFAESKRRRRDSIRRGQIQFLENAQAEGVSPASFLFVEWDVA